MRIWSVLILSAFSISQFSHADELDYLTNSDMQNGNLNFMLILDGSSSLSELYKSIKAYKDPAIYTSDPDVIKLINTKNALNAQLLNSSSITPSLTIEFDNNYCPGGAGVIQEGVFNSCPVPTQRRWYLRRISVVRDIVRDSLPLFKGNNLAIMRTGRNGQSFLGWVDDGKKSNVNTRILYPDAGIDDNGGYIIDAFKVLETEQDILDTADRLNVTFDMHAPKSNVQKSPIVETIFEAYKVFAGETSVWDKKTNKGWQQKHLDNMDLDAFKNRNSNNAYLSPITECSSNHIIYLTDGRPTYDWHANDTLISSFGFAQPTPPVTGDVSEDSTPAHTLLDEFVGYMMSNDVNSQVEGEQFVQTHFISTWPSSESSEMLDVTSAASGGLHLRVDNLEEIHAKLKELVEQIKSSKQPAVGYKVTATNETGNPFQPMTDAYVNIWQLENGKWSGNLKKFNLDADGQLRGKNNELFIASMGTVNKDVRDLWSSTQAGTKNLEGGAVERQSAIGADRYLLPRGVKNINPLQNQYAVNAANSMLTKERLEVATSQDREDLLHWAAGQDSYDFNKNGDFTDLRPSIGAQINTQPAVAHYSSGTQASPVVFTGGNDGFLRAWDGKSGQHLYSLMPEQLLPKLSGLKNFQASKQYGVDGQIFVWHKDTNQDFNLLSGAGALDVDERLMVFFGLGKGGSSFYALDVTQRTSPRLAWSIDDKVAGFERMGQSWAKPTLATLKSASNQDKDMVIIAGGMDPALALGPVTGDHLGNTLYILDAYKGDKVWRISNRNADVIIPEMKYSLISAPVTVDLNADGKTDAFFANDIRGQIFRCDFTSTSNQDNQLACGLIASAQNATENLMFMGSLDLAFVGNKSSNIKIALSLTSGNRLKPNDILDKNRAVVIFDSNVVTAPSSYNYSESQSISLADLGNKSVGALTTDETTFGWYFNFPVEGEKSFAQTLIFNNSIFFSTHTPGTGSASCDSIDLGIARIYGFDINAGGQIPGLTSIDNVDGMVWKGPARGLPDTPYIVTELKDNKMQATINLGVDNTALSVTVNPFSRTYWYQKN